MNSIMNFEILKGYVILYHSNIKIFDLTPFDHTPKTNQSVFGVIMTDIFFYILRRSNREHLHC